ncbi:MAG: WbqC family protein [Arcicella sp.]|nr:WbqC family protein [Arcicella sp.]
MKKYFAKENLQMNFIKSLAVEYKQFKNEFVPWLSMIDVLMFNSKEEINKFLDNYELV